MILQLHKSLEPVQHVLRETIEWAHRPQRSSILEWVDVYGPFDDRQLSMYMIMAELERAPNTNMKRYRN